MYIVLSGGGTIGSVSPLIAVALELRKREEGLELKWIGTKNGPEKKLVKHYAIDFAFIQSGKWRRYFSLRNLIAPFLTLIGFFQALYILIFHRPDIIISAGSFVSVPVVWAGWILRIPSIIHQQDILPGLSNKLMAFFAKKITVCFQESLKDFKQNKTVWIGNPIREDIVNGNRERALEEFNLEKDLPVVLITGGGTGALALNRLVVQALTELVKFCQVIHLTGEKKHAFVLDFPQEILARYHVYDFLDQKMKNALAIADLVVSRAGLSILTELAYLAKPAIIVPIPHSQQEDNANYFAHKGAVKILKQNNLDIRDFVDTIRALLKDEEKRKKLSENIAKIFPENGTEMMVKEILNMVK